MPAPLYLQLETRVATAHRHVRLAAELADALGSLSLYDDLFAIAIELERIQTALLKGLPQAPIGRKVQ